MRTNLPLVFLKPGEMHWAEEPTIVSTILGSCVAVTMFSQIFQISAVCHCLLPACQNRISDNGNNDNCFKYVESSIHQLLAKFDQRGIKQHEMEFKLFGGSDMFQTNTSAKSYKSVGKQNIEIAKQIIETEGLNLITSDVGGTLGRKIHFYTHTGAIYLKRLNNEKVL